MMLSDLFRVDWNTRVYFAPVLTSPMMLSDLFRVDWNKWDRRRTTAVHGMMLSDLFRVDWNNSPNIKHVAGCRMMLSDLFRVDWNSGNMGLYYSGLTNDALWFIQSGLKWINHRLNPRWYLSWCSLIYSEWIEIGLDNSWIIQAGIMMLSDLFRVDWNLKKEA